MPGLIDVTLPLFAKIVVKGPGQHLLYAMLTGAQPVARTLPRSDFRAKLVGYGMGLGAPDQVLWNFEKLLVDRRGTVVERLTPDGPPDDSMVIAAVEGAGQDVVARVRRSAERR